MAARPRMVVLDGYTMGRDVSWQALADLGPLTVYDRTEPEQVLERALGADVLLTNKTVLDAAAIEALPELKCILVLATGYNVVDVAAAARRNIPVCNVPGYSPPSVAQHVLSVVLELFSHTSLHAQSVAKGRWSAQPDFCFWDAPVVELSGKTFGVVGFGAIGRRVAELAHAFGMRVLAHVPRPKPAPAYEPFAFAGLDELFAQSDVVSLHASGRLAGAALDVVRVEPIRVDNPLLAAPNCLITPHVAWASVEARTRLMAGVAANLAAFLAGTPQNVVNEVP